MKRKTFPLWLLRDVPALIGLALSFWPLMILVISNGHRAMRGKTIAAHVYETLMRLLPLAEACLHHALCRQAYRALGWNPRLARLQVLPPLGSWDEFGPRFETYRADMMDLAATAQRFTDSVRRHLARRARVDANTSRPVPARAVYRRDTPTATTTQTCTSLAALIPRRPKAVSKDEGGLANARGPPNLPDFRLPTAYCPSAQRAWDRTAMPS